MFLVKQRIKLNILQAYHEIDRFYSSCVQTTSIAIYLMPLDIHNERVIPHVAGEKINNLNYWLHSLVPLR